MKVLPFTSEEDFNKNEHEISKLQNNQHRNVVGFVEVIVEGNAHFVVLELCSCSLADRISESRKLGTTMDRVTVFRIVSDVLAGLGFLHSRNEVYGDQKPSNILIGCDCRAKLGDFGGVVGVGTVKTWNSAECGTMQFWGPEMFVVGGNGGSGSQAGDMWAFGLIVFELLTGQEWISGTNAVEIAESVKAFDVQAVCQKAKIPNHAQDVVISFIDGQKSTTRHTTFVAPDIFPNHQAHYTHANPQERLPSAELIRSGRLMKILGEETPLSQFIREELETTKHTLDEFKAKWSESEENVARLEREKAEWMEERKTQLSMILSLQKEMERIQQEDKQLRSELASKTQKLEENERVIEDQKRTIEKTKTEVARKEPIVASDVFVAFSPEHCTVSGSTITRISYTNGSFANCFTKPVSKGIHRLSIKTENEYVMLGMIDATEYPNYLTKAVYYSPNAAMMQRSDGCLHSASDNIAQNRMPPKGQEWSAEADLEKRTLHFFIDGVQQQHHFINIPVPLVFAVDIYYNGSQIEITFLGELKKSMRRRELVAVDGCSAVRVEHINPSSQHNVCINENDPQSLQRSLIALLRRYLNHVTEEQRNDLLHRFGASFSLQAIKVRSFHSGDVEIEFILQIVSSDEDIITLFHSSGLSHSILKKVQLNHTDHRHLEQLVTISKLCPLSPIVSLTDDLTSIFRSFLCDPLPYLIKHRQNRQSSFGPLLQILCCEMLACSIIGCGDVIFQTIVANFPSLTKALSHSLFIHHLSNDHYRLFEQIVEISQNHTDPVERIAAFINLLHPLTRLQEIDNRDLSKNHLSQCLQHTATFLNAHPDLIDSFLELIAVSPSLSDTLIRHDRHVNLISTLSQSSSPLFTKLSEPLLDTRFPLHSLLSPRSFTDTASSFIRMASTNPAFFRRLVKKHTGHILDIALSTVVMTGRVVSDSSSEPHCLDFGRATQNWVVLLNTIAEVGMGSERRAWFGT
ncbi:putative Protein kinase domain containing protein [Blattamonas nauphoetae]|uniref:Protein kinase domain-containing protein n=1 Tax=Blattamonas nauphoetae TaxID=2049346 RepID=A0ABQ9XEB6_9EUKA|nr:putative Protein kinase domain containing protein [Blattamonas nauphoetae]